MDKPLAPLGEYLQPISGFLLLCIWHWYLIKRRPITFVDYTIIIATRFKSLLWRAQCRDKKNISASIEDSCKSQCILTNFIAAIMLCEKKKSSLMPGPSPGKLRIIITKCVSYNLLLMLILDLKNWSLCKSLYLFCHNTWFSVLPSFFEHVVACICWRGLINQV